MTKFNSQGANYVKAQRRSYFLYVLESRSIPHIADGLKSAARRLLWVARDGSKNKTATIAGAALPYHPHAVPDDVASLMACPFVNNIPLFEGSGDFGTLVVPKSYAAPRYTSVKVSEFTKSVVFRDIEVIPMIRNYDDTLDEPKHFLPLVPVALLNPTFGIAGGFQSSIMPRSLEDIVMSQIEHLEGSKKLKERFPKFTPTKNVAVERTIDPKSGNIRWKFEGDYEEINAFEVWITKLPFGKTHSDLVNHLAKMEDSYDVIEVTDHSKDQIKVRVKLPRGVINNTDRDGMLKKLGLINTETELLNVIDFDGTSVLQTNYVDVITKFTDWRLGWYVQRYERLLKLIMEEIQRYKDVIRAIEKNVGGVAKKTISRAELLEFLEAIGIVNLEYIASLPVYRFIEEEATRTKEKLEEAELKKKEYEDLLSHEPKRRKIYVQELKDILKQFSGW
jgi:DNA gyrase subunit A